MRRILACILALLMLCICSGCSGQKDIQETKELVISRISTEGTNLNGIIERFEQDTGIKVTVQSYRIGAEGYAPFQQQTLTELMARSGADIYEVTQLQYNQLGEQGLLYDFSPLLGEDEVFNDETMLLDVVKASSPTEHVYGIPMSFGLYAMTARSLEVAQQMREQNYNWKEFVDLGRTFQPIGKLTELFDLNIFQLWLWDQPAGLIDETNLENPLNTQMVRDMLEQLQEWVDQGVCYSMGEINQGKMPNLNEDGLFAQCFIQDTQQYMLAQDDSIEVFDPRFANYENPMPTEHPEEKDRYIPALWDVYGINAGSENQEAAVEFIRYMVKYQNLYYQNEPRTYTNRNVFEDMAEENLQDNILRDFLGENTDVEATAAKMIARLDEITFQPAMDDVILDTMTQAAYDYMNFEISMEEALETMEDTIRLYLQEKG